MALASLLRALRNCLAYLLKRPDNYPRHRLRLEELERRDVPAAALTPPLYLDFAAGNAPSALGQIPTDQVADTAKDAANVGQTYGCVSGIYSLGIPDGAIPQAVLDNPYVDGIALRATWDHIETANGVYDWSYLDSQIDAAAAAGKKVSLSIAAGIDTPTWVYDAGADSFTYIDKNSPTPHVIPVPWDPTFLAQWQEFVQAFGARYAANPAVVSVKITGINSATEETLLPHSTGQTVTVGTTTWTTTNDVANWQSIGYTRQKVEDAWLAIADTFSQAFPASRICLMVVPNGFPPIDDHGQVIAGSGDNQLVNDLIGLGTDRYAQFVVQNNGLSDFWVSSQVASAAPQVTTGYQMLWRVTNDSTGRMDDWTPGCDPHAVLQAAVDKGLAANGRYLEIYQMDILNADLQDVLAIAHSRIANAPPTATIVGVPTSAPTHDGPPVTLGSQVADSNLVDMAAGFSYAWTVTRNGKIYATGADSSFTFASIDRGILGVHLTVTDNDAGQSSPTTVSMRVAPRALAGARAAAAPTDLSGTLPDGPLNASLDQYGVGFANA